MFTKLLTTFDVQSGNRANLEKHLENYGSRTVEAEIDLQEFVDSDLDVAGWYALGHHRPNPFMNAVAKHEPGCKLAQGYIRLVWAGIHDRQVKYYDMPLKGTQPITMIIFFE